MLSSSPRLRGRALLLLWALARGWNLVYVMPAIGVLLYVRSLVPDFFDPPQLLSAVPVQAPTSAAFGVVLSLLIASTAVEPCPAVLAISVLRRRMLPLGRVVTLTTFVVAVLSTFGSGRTSANSLLALVGEALLVASMIGVRYSWTLPLVHGTTAALFGTDAFGSLSPWAWLLSTRPTTTGLCVSVLIFLCGLLAIARRPFAEAD